MYALRTDQQPHASDKGFISSPTRRANYSSWIDCAKGIGIAAVVFGHTGVGTKAADFLYVWHMPLFFFLSGFLHKPQQDLNAYFKKKVFHLIVPYCAFLLTMLAANVLMVLHRGGGTSQIAPLFINAAWGGSRLSGPYGVVWFAPCLFMTQQAMNLILVRTTQRAAAILAALCLGFSYLTSVYVHASDVPLDAHVTLAAIPLFFVGSLVRNRKFDMWWVRATSLCGLIASAILIRSGHHISYNMKGGDYGVPFLSFLLALLSIIAVLNLSQMVAKYSILAMVPCSIGAASMGIMYVHKMLWAIPKATAFASSRHFVAFLVFLIVSYLATRLLDLFPFTRKYFLGSSATVHPSYSTTGKDILINK